MKNRIKAHLIKMSDSRGRDKTFCPSEVARELFKEDEWRSQMDLIRSLADELVAEGQLVVMQKNKPIAVKPSEAVGPIRLRKK